ncbi:MAG TPA: peptidylprolyl isomerase [Verrucomicrobiae bacterium]
MKLIFSAALAVALFVLPRAQAVSPDAMTNAPTAKPADSMTALFGNPVIAKGNGVEVKQSDLDEVMTGMKSAAAAHGQTIPADQMNLIQVQMLNRLIQIQLLLQKSTDADKADGKKKADEQLSELLDKAGSQETLDRQLKAVGMTADELRSKVTQEATATAALTRELGVAVTDAEVTQFYGSHPEEFEQPEQVHVRHILLMTMDPTTRQPLPADQVAAKRKQIDAILKRIRAGEDFSKLATQYSEDPGSKDKGGELPAFSKGEMVPEFEAAAFSLTNNQVSDVITTAYGYHVIKLLDKTPGKKVALTDKVPGTDITITDKIKDYLLQQKTEKLAPAYLDKLKKDADVEILDADLKAAEAAVAAAATNAPADMPGAGN